MLLQVSLCRYQVKSFQHHLPRGGAPPPCSGIANAPKCAPLIHSILTAQPPNNLRNAPAEQMRGGAIHCTPKVVAR